MCSNLTDWKPLSSPTNSVLLKALSIQHLFPVFLTDGELWRTNSSPNLRADSMPPSDAALVMVVQRVVRAYEGVAFSLSGSRTLKHTHPPPPPHPTPHHQTKANTWRVLYPLNPPPTKTHTCFHTNTYTFHLHPPLPPPTPPSSPDDRLQENRKRGRDPTDGIEISPSCRSLSKHDLTTTLADK